MRLENLGYVGRGASSESAFGGNAAQSQHVLHGIVSRRQLPTLAPFSMDGRSVYSLPLSLPGRAPDTMIRHPIEGPVANAVVSHP